jgi:MFS family permease
MIEVHDVLMTLRVPRSIAFVGMSIAMLAFFVAAGAPTSIFPLYERAWGFPPTMLTFAFGIYAIALIVTLLVLGSLSDYIGRRPLMIAALVVELASMIIFLVAPSIGWLIAGRVLQGLATGVASSAFGAAVVELASERRKKIGIVMTSLATTAGLGIGALLAGVVARAIPESAAGLVWTILIIVMAAGTALALVTPETSPRRVGALASLIPRVAVPPRARRLFAVIIPTAVAIFLTTALFQGLLPTILRVVFGVTDPISIGALNFVLFTLAAAAAGFTGAVRPHLLRTVGTAAIALSAVLLLAAFASESLVFIWLAAIAAGVGAGSALSGSTRGLVPQVEPHQRAALFAAFFLVAYVTLSIAIIGSGYLAAATSVQFMAALYVVILAMSAITGLLLGIRTVRRDRNHPVPA